MGKDFYFGIEFDQRKKVRMKKLSAKILIIISILLAATTNSNANMFNKFKKGFYFEKYKTAEEAKVALLELHPIGSGVGELIKTLEQVGVKCVITVQLFIFLLLTSCVGIGFFHESKLERNAFPLEYKCSEINSDPCFPAHIRKEYLLKKFEKPERIEKIGNNQEKLVYKNGLGWSGFNIMIGIPIPVGIPTYRKYKYFYLRDDVVFRIGENYSELFGVWCGFNGGILNDKTHKVEWFGCVTKLK